MLGFPPDLLDIVLPVHPMQAWGERLGRLVTKREGEDDLNLGQSSSASGGWSTTLALVVCAESSSASFLWSQPLVAASRR